MASETYLKDQVDRALKEVKILKQRVDVLEKENMSLKKSLYEISTRYFVNSQHKKTPLLVDSIDEEANNIPSDVLNEVSVLNNEGPDRKSKETRHFLHKCDLKVGA